MNKQESNLRRVPQIKQEILAAADMRPIAMLSVVIQCDFEFCSSINLDTKDLVRQSTTF